VFSGIIAGIFGGSKLMPSLYTRLGGADRIEEIVELMYSSVLADERLSGYFDGVNLTRQRHSFRAFLNVVTSGPDQYSGIELRAVHADSVDKGLAGHHIDAFLEHLRRAFETAEIPPPLIDEAMSRVSAYRDDVLGL
jgi:hemoglobin